jgi:hypothetical protein
MAELRVDIALLSLFPATPAQLEESRLRTWPQWGGTLSLKEYLGRYTEMDIVESAKDGKLITW